MDEITIYTDGGCWPNPGKGGWAFVVENGTACYGGNPGTTNNRMELEAVLMALRYAKSEHTGKRVRIVSDSQYVVKGCTQWMQGWIKKGWTRKTKQGIVPVLNDDLWKQIREEMNSVNALFSWVRGHNGNRFNEMADSLASRGASSGVPFSRIEDKKQGLSVMPILVGDDWPEPISHWTSDFLVG